MLAVTGDEQRRRTWSQFLYLRQQRQSVHTGHLNIAYDGIVIVLADQIDGCQRRIGCTLAQRRPEAGEKLASRPRRRLVRGREKGAHRHDGDDEDSPRKLSRHATNPLKEIKGGNRTRPFYVPEAEDAKGGC